MQYEEVKWDVARSRNTTNQFFNEFRNHGSPKEKIIYSASMTAAPPGLTATTTPTLRTPSTFSDDIKMNKIDLPPEQSPTDMFNIADIYEPDLLVDMTGSSPVKTGAESSQQEGAEVTFSEPSKKPRLNNLCAEAMMTFFAAKMASISSK